MHGVTLVALKNDRRKWCVLVGYFTNTNRPSNGIKNLLIATS